MTDKHTYTSNDAVISHNKNEIQKTVRYPNTPIRMAKINKN